jgi:calcineurin-like phosphoesterase family protein
MESRVALEEWLLDRFENFLNKTPHDRLIIVGDLFAKRSVSEKTIKRVHGILKGRNVVLIRGNHDSVSDKYGEISSLELLAHLLDCKLVFNSPELTDDYYIIPHMFNQEQFDQALSEVPNNVSVLLHCNLDNPFAVGDHSLNITDSQVKEISAKGCDIIMGHEHTARDLYDGKVKVLGCGWPTSIADCLGGSKRALLGGRSITTWGATDYREVHHEDPFIDIDSNFISIVGECTKAEYPSVVKRVAAFRAKSDAFIIKNNVKVLESEKSEINQEVTSFNVVDVFINEIPSEYKERVQLCLSQE